MNGKIWPCGEEWSCTGYMLLQHLDLPQWMPSIHIANWHGLKKGLIQTLQTYSYSINLNELILIILGLQCTKQRFSDKLSWLSPIASKLHILPLGPRYGPWRTFKICRHFHTLPACWACSKYGFVWKCWVYSQWNSHLIGIMIINHWV